ncbi:MAG TPA: DUF2911 domain-containing protein, partial [Phycisphaerae bacterium]
RMPPHFWRTSILKEIFMKLGKLSLLTLCGILAFALPAAAQRGGAPATSTLTQPRASPHDAVNTRVGGTLVTIYYGRPYMKGRVVWGTLVPWDAVWRLGSDEGTTLICSKDLVFGDFTLPAGAYTLEMVPSKDGVSKLVFNKAIGYWGIPYTAIQDQELKRVDLKKDPDLDKSVEQLTLVLESSGTLKIQWDKSQYSITFKVK